MLNTALLFLVLSQVCSATPTADFDCSTCTEYYPDLSYETSPILWDENTAPLTSHSCGSSGNTSACCVKSRNNCFVRDKGSLALLYPCDSCDVNSYTSSPSPPPPPEQSENESIDKPEPVEYDCSRCEVYYANDNMITPVDLLGTASSLLDNAWCNNGGNTSSCCVRSQSGQCGMYDPLADSDGPLYPCGQCPPLSSAPIKEPEKEEAEIDKCSLCTRYYPSAAMSTPTNELGESSLLTNHACARSDDWASPRPDARIDTTGCCQTAPDGRCGVYGYGMFIYPCDSCHALGDPPMETPFSWFRSPWKLAAIIVGGLVGAVMLNGAIFVWSGRRRQQCKELTMNELKNESCNPTKTEPKLDTDNGEP